MTIFLTGASVIICLLLVGWVACHRVRHIKRASDLEGEFFKSAGALVDSDETPEPVIEVLCMMAQDIASPSFPRWMFRRWLTGRMGETMRDEEDAWQHFSATLDEMQPAQYALMRNSMYCFVLASTYQSLVLGWMLRHVMLFAVSRVNRRKPVVDDRRRARGDEDRRRARGDEDRRRARGDEDRGRSRGYDGRRNFHGDEDVQAVVSDFVTRTPGSDCGLGLLTAG